MVNIRKAGPGLTAAAQTDRDFLRLFKEAITPVGVLNVADARWFAEEGGGSAASPGGASGGFTATARFPADAEWPMHIIRRHGLRFGKLLEDRLVEKMFEELSGFRRVLRPRKGGLSDPAVFQFPYPKLYELAGVGGRDGVWVMTAMAWGKCRHQYHDLIELGRRRHILDDGVHTLDGEPVFVRWLNGEALGVLYGDFRRGLRVTVAEAEPPPSDADAFADPETARLHVEVKWSVVDADRFVCWE